MTVWHNLMAIWLWRLLISVIEGTNIPGIASAIDFILYYIPNFYLWVTVFIFAALVTKQTADHHHVGLIAAPKIPLTLICLSMPIHGMQDVLQDLKQSRKKDNLAGQYSEVSSPTSVILSSAIYFAAPLIS